MNRTRLILSLSAFCLGLVMMGSSGTSAGDKKVPTFSKDIAPIFYNNCISCHRSGEIAPMSLVSYKEVRPWARSIREKVVTRTMPPWYADPNHGKWANDRRLSQKDIDTISAWVEGGSPEGNSKDLRRRRNWRADGRSANPTSCSTCQLNTQYRLKERFLISTSRLIRSSLKTDISTRWKRAPEICRSFTIS